MALGTLNGRAVLAGSGNSFAQMLGSADGEAQLAMGRGKISNLVLEIVDLDAAEALGFLVGRRQDGAVRCALFDVGFKSGLMEGRTAIFDTDDTIVSASGQVNFADETLNLRVTPVPKDPSPLTLRVPFDVKGTLEKMQVAPDRTKLALRAGAAIALGAVNPRRRAAAADRDGARQGQRLRSADRAREERGRAGEERAHRRGAAAGRSPPLRTGSSRCAIGSTVAGSQVSSSPSARTS